VEEFSAGIPGGRLAGRAACIFLVKINTLPSLKLEKRANRKNGPDENFKRS
jgi:hypothetical protein